MSASPVLPTHPEYRPALHFKIRYFCALLFKPSSRQSPTRLLLSFRRFPDLCDFANAPFDRPDRHRRALQLGRRHTVQASE
jgi:hypothetical protein